MKKFALFLVIIALCLPSLSVSAADGFFYTKSGNQVEIITSKTMYEGSTLVIARYNSNDAYSMCEVVDIKTVEFTGDNFSSGVFTVERGYDYKYMVFEGLNITPMTKSVMFNIDTPYRIENTSDDEGTPRF